MSVAGRKKKTTLADAAAAEAAAASAAVAAAAAAAAAVGVAAARVGKAARRKRSGKSGTAEQRRTALEMKRGDRVMTPTRFEFAARRNFNKYLPSARIKREVFPHMQLMCEDRMINSLYADKAVIDGSSKKVVTLMQRINETRNAVHSRIGHYRQLN